MRKSRDYSVGGMTGVTLSGRFSERLGFEVRVLC